MISIHALLAESDLVLLATEIQFENFYPRSPCGERPHGRAAAGCGIHISIHALLAESDDAYLAALGKGVQISIHALLAESDYPKQENYPQSNISIHALLAESDPIMRKYCPSTKISIHALLAESDHPNHRAPWDQHRFLSTLSLRRATASRLRRSSPKLYFYPRSPCGERHTHHFPALHHILISIHALLAESDSTYRHQGQQNPISIHALLAESDDY